MAMRPADFIGKPWFESVLLCVEDIGKVKFQLSDVYDYEDILSEAYPDNNRIQSKIRQTLQYLRKAGIINFVDGKGRYEIIAKELLPQIEVDYSRFEVIKTALPNYPLSEVRQKSQPNISGVPRMKDALDRLRDERLGEAGEQVVIFREREILNREGREDLAKKIEQVSKTKGDYIGYDILSFDLSGAEKWIEVKTTKGRQSTKFHISENQISTSESHPTKYHLHRLYDFSLENQMTNLYVVSGNLRTPLSLDPTHHLAAVGDKN